MDDVIIVGAGIGGLTLGLALHGAGIPCRTFESAAEIKAVGVGINLLPHATKELAAPGLEQALAKVAIATTDATFFNRFGQLIYQEPLGRTAGYDHPQFSIHRGDLQMVLLDAFRARAGHDRLSTNHHCVAVEQDASGVSVHFSDGPGGSCRSTKRGRAAIACDGINSAVRKQFFPEEGEPRYSGVHMWRGVTLSGDAAHPMVPRGSNGAGQAILDARALTTALLENSDSIAALAAYEKQRLEATTRIVLTNRINPPDAILREVYERTSDRPFEAIEDVISRAELLAMSDSYKRIAGFSREALRA